MKLFFRKAIFLLMTLIGWQFLLTNQLFAQQKTVLKKDSIASNNTTFIEILESNYTDIIKTGTESITKIVGGVKLRSGTDILYCDSAILYQNKKVAEAFGNVSIEQADGTTAFSEYLKYTGATKVIYMTGDVILSDNKGNTLWSEEVEYNLNTKIGKYFKNGTLENESTVLSSKTGTYNLKNKDAFFKGDVVVNDPEYSATSEDLAYNTDTKIVRFFANAVVQNENTTLFPKPGSTYDANKKLATFKGRSNIIHQSQFIEADDMKYNQNTGWAIGKGNVIVIDTAEKTTVYGGLLTYNEISGKMMVTDKPIMKRSGEDDTLYILGDTLFSEPIANLERPHAGPIDTMQLEMNELIEKLQKGVFIDSTTLPYQNDSVEPIDTIFEIPEIDTIIGNDTSVISLDTVSNLHLNDSLNSTIIVDSLLPIPIIGKKNVDSLSINISNPLSHLKDRILEDRPNKPTNTIGNNPGNKLYDKSDAEKNKQEEENKPRYFLIYHNVLVFSDSAQAKCDSMRYSQSDSLMILYKNPAVWAKKAQILGDTIYALLDSSKIQEVFVPKNAILIQQNGPDRAGLFDQVQSMRLHAFFINNELDSAVAFPEVETIYFSTDDDSAYIGASRATSERLRFHFKDRKIKKIHYINDFNQKMTPMQQVNPEDFKLKRFNWREAERPKTLEDFLSNATEFQKKEILGERYKNAATEIDTSKNKKEKQSTKKPKK